MLSPRLLTTKSFVAGVAGKNFVIKNISNATATEHVSGIGATSFKSVNGKE